MPILHVRALPQKDPSRVGLALKQTCLAIAKFYDCDPSQVWATFDEIRPGCYVEGDSAPLAQPSDTHPPIAQLTCFKGTPPEKVEELLGRVLISLDLTRKILSEANESRAGKGGRRRTQRYVEVDFDEHVSVANEKTFAVV